MTIDAHHSSPRVAWTASTGEWESPARLRRLFCKKRLGANDPEYRLFDRDPCVNVLRLAAYAAYSDMGAAPSASPEHSPLTGPCRGAAVENL